jgi:nitroreductase
MCANQENREATYDVLKSVIKSRRTTKVLGQAERPVAISPEICEKNRPLVLDAIRVAGWAPFHYARNVDSVAEPWRFHVLWHPSCRAIACDFLRLFPDSKPNNKLPAMLTACSALVIVNWLPQLNLSESAEKTQEINEEHLAATAAAVQNLLLLLTAQGMGTYWSSGGQFRAQAMFDWLGIPSTERLLAAVFVEFPEIMDQPLERLPGKHRDQRADVNKWMRIVEVT